MGFFQNAYKNITEARQRQADRYVNGALLRMDDASLRSMGKTREELRRNSKPGLMF